MREGLTGAAATPDPLPAGGKQSGAAVAVAMQLPTSHPAQLLTGSLKAGGPAAKSAALGEQPAQASLMMPICLLTRWVYHMPVHQPALGIKAITRCNTLSLAGIKIMGPSLILTFSCHLQCFAEL